MKSKHLAALVWLLIELLAAGYLGYRLSRGLHFQSDLMALLPREEQNPQWQRSNDLVTNLLSRRVVIMVGSADRASARTAAADLGRTLSQAGLVNFTAQNLDKSQLVGLGKLYFPYRRGLLSAQDHALLLNGKTSVVAAKALAQAYGFMGIASPGLLRRDPFLLLQDFFTALPASAVAPDDGMLSVNAEGKTWIMLNGVLTGTPYDLTVQHRLTEVLNPAEAAQHDAHPGLSVLRLGAVFFAEAGADQAINESSRIGVVSTIGAVLLVLILFRAASPVWLTLLTIGSGVITALAACLLLFGELHVGALLFGVSLIGVAVDYCLQYCTELFALPPKTPTQRLRSVLVGISLGAATTIIGYLTLMLAPFPGLHQIAAFSAVGLFAALTSVVLWLPLLDRSTPPRHGGMVLAVAGGVLAGWENPAWKKWRLALLGLLGLLAAAGLPRLHADDNVRRMQSLSAPLVAQQEHIERLIGSTGNSQYVLVQAPNTEIALQREETLAERLRPLLGTSLSGFQSLAEYVPSTARQRANRALLRATLDGAATQAQAAKLGLTTLPAVPSDNAPMLTPDLALRGPLSALSALVLPDPGQTLHLVTLNGVTQPQRVAAAINGLPGVRFVDPAGDFSRLLGKYRGRAMWLLALSALLMLPPLAWRYGLRGSLRVMAPPLAAVALAPALLALAGGGFSFFDAMALVLILSVGVDYAVFFAETDGARKSVTMLAVAMAAATALLSFGMLAFSQVTVVHEFGLTMSTGIALAFVLAPLARGTAGTPKGHWSHLAERGVFLGMRSVSWVYFGLGRSTARLMLLPIVGYFFLTDRLRRAASRQYLSRLRAQQGLPPPSTADLFRHFLDFATKALETFIAWSRPDQVPLIGLTGEEALETHIAAEQGGLIIISHLGNAELSRSLLERRFKAPLNVLLHTKHAAQYNRLLRLMAPGVASHTIEVSEIGPETAIDLVARVQRGEWIAIAGDRTPLDGGRTVMAPFLGAAAEFSVGPYVLASLMKCPVFLLFCLREAGGHSIYLEPFADIVLLPRRDKQAALSDLAARYAARLEHYCRRAPYQWYNFFDFWTPPAEGPSWEPEA